MRRQYRLDRRPVPSLQPEGDEAAGAARGQPCETTAEPVLAHALHEAPSMHHTTIPVPALESIDTAILLFVSGGCHKRGCCSPKVIVVPPSPPAPAATAAVATASAPAPAAAPAPDPTPAQPSGDIITTSVSINGKSVA
jgi:hypothetical protein